MITIENLIAALKVADIGPGSNEYIDFSEPADEICIDGTYNVTALLKALQAAFDAYAEAARAP